MTAPFGSRIDKAIRAVVRRTTITGDGYRSTPPSQWSCFSCRMNSQLGQVVTPLRRPFQSTAIARDRVQRPDIARAADGPLRTPAATSKALPSHTAKQRSALSKRLSEITDSILARASIAGQHINTYTGTDFSGIEALRREIEEEETAVKTRHVSVADAKSRLTEAQANQAASQKEIVGLLERKSSWSPTDLERYMSLVRSEHVEEQNVQMANEKLASSERELEDTRALLERLERKQYHEEQIWSDTIRRNSTWVTIGLMGVNILLLLAQISVFEPYRRRMIVQQVKEALDERTAESGALNTITKQIDAVIEPAGVSLEQLESPATVADPSMATTENTPATLPSSVGAGVKQTSQGYLRRAREVVDDLFSERRVQLKQVDVTTVALESAAAGMAFAGVVALAFLRSSH